MENVIHDPNSAINLIRTEFGATLAEMKTLTLQDRQELASAIARQRGLDMSKVTFKVVEY